MNIESLTILDNPCNNCYESYCYKNCDKYEEWEKNVEAVKNAIEENGLTKFFLPKEVIENGSTYGKTCNKKQYICPNCGKIISRVICTTTNKPNHCYRCGQLLIFKGVK